MKCRAVRARAHRTEDGRPIVSLVMGNMRPVGCIDEEAWAELPPGMAREIARDLIAAADEIEPIGTAPSTNPQWCDCIDCHRPSCRAVGL